MGLWEQHLKTKNQENQGLNFLLHLFFTRLQGCAFLFTWWGLIPEWVTPEWVLVVVLVVLVVVLVVLAVVSS